MKNRILFILSAVALLISCKKDFLNRPSPNNPTLDNFYNTPEQVEGATGFLYNQPWAGFMDKAFNCIGDVLGGNMLTPAGDPNYGNNTYVYFTVSGTDGQNLLAWQSFYKVAGNATVLMNTLEQKKSEIGNASFLDEGIAEARFIRGAAYFYIARTYGDAPIVSDPVVLAGSGDYNIPKYIQKDVLRFALEDFKAAAAGLPETPYQPGRVTKYSAQGMMAKLYLYRGDFDSAATAANEVMSSGKYSLFADYEGMFTNSGNNNNSESLFALQWIATGGYSYANAAQAYEAPQTLLKPDFNTGYSSVYPTLDILSAYDPGDKRKGWSNMLQGFSRLTWKNANFPNGFVYDTLTPLGHDNDDPYTFKNGTRSNVLKYIVGPAENGNLGGTSELTNSQGGNSMCTYLLRYADVLLIYAESVLGNSVSTTDPAAVNAFNLVHTRAGLPPVSSLTKDMIMHERRVEFAFEGDYWYDVQRQGFQKAQQIINAQERGTLNNDGSVNHTSASFTTAAQLYMPIPSSEVIADPALSKDAVPYY